MKCWSASSQISIRWIEKQKPEKKKRVKQNLNLHRGKVHQEGDKVTCISKEKTRKYINIYLHRYDELYDKSGEEVYIKKRASNINLNSPKMPKAKSSGLAKLKRAISATLFLLFFSLEKEDSRSRDSNLRITYYTWLCAQSAEWRAWQQFGVVFIGEASGGNCS